ncbi:expressed unknown protein [Seminavis robusta]|uniref:Uncharacterized protein n=1 Tax=Seminavis robusta TaxID=568900 RepID=A0A9N8DUY7_9STRA|nr:expressed unknown protein [Seminavis robusta]|eukprot:Sro390_g132980.1 n/a (228) ;mRNA; r:64305-64988
MAPKTIIQLNEDAIFFLKDGDHQRTTSTLLTAFTFLDSVTTMSAQHAQLDPAFGFKRKLPPIASFEIPETPVPHGYHVGNDLFTYYNRALSVPACMGDMSYESNTRLSAIIQYNLGLAYHRAGIQENSTAQLSKALQLYEGAYFTIERVKDRVHMEDVFVLLLGIFFNMTHIHCNSFNLTECNHCMDWMKIALASRECVTLREDDYLFFSTNISLLSIQMPHLAPAA